ncbi:MAG: hypothetical protein IJT01_01760 [Selenomonadaceae bacterium]|nr:hypothetical protein [Selenomonadaceae bacterium]
MAMVRMTLEEAKKIMTPEKRREEIRRAKEIGFVYDPDCPPCSEEKLARFKRGNHRKIVS